MGDSRTKNDELNDLIVTANGDTPKVLATVAHSIYLFTEQYSDAWIFAKGSTPSRTRLYQMGISQYLDVIGEDFEVIAETEEDWEPFQNCRTYIAFAVRRKLINSNYENSY